MTDRTRASKRMDMQRVQPRASFGSYTAIGVADADKRIKAVVGMVYAPTRDIRIRRFQLYDARSGGSDDRREGTPRSVQTRMLIVALSCLN
jgi:hypothetical protein